MGASLGYVLSSLSVSLHECQNTRHKALEYITFACSMTLFGRVCALEIGEVGVELDSLTVLHLIYTSSSHSFRDFITLNNKLGLSWDDWQPPLLLSLGFKLCSIMKFSLKKRAQLLCCSECLVLTDDKGRWRSVYFLQKMNFCWNRVQFCKPQICWKFTFV